MQGFREVRGFTIVEVIVAIGIIAIMAAFAYPRYIMVETEARKALVVSLSGAINSAAQQAHYLWILEGEPATIDMEGQTITMVNGYPDEDSIDDTLIDYSGFQFRTNPAPVRFRRTDAPQPNNCMVSYVEAVPPGRPTVTADTSGC